ncbi:MAG: restriction endonuclease [Candidatus Omnitrophota bacterium]|jgi:hypothetical protein
MGKVSSQYVASLVGRSPTKGQVRLSEAISLAWKEQGLPYDSEDQLSEEIEKLQKDVFKALVEKYAALENKCIKPAFTIEDDNGTYFFTCSPSLEMPVLKKIIDEDAKQFEVLCGEILKKLGAKAEIVSGDDDGGVDFVGYDLPLGCIKLETTIANQLLVIGQAKRYKGGLISETRLREFVGAATKKRYDLLVERKFNVKYSQPTIFAYWTTSDFDAVATKYAQQMGLWVLNGTHIAQLVIALGLNT